MIAGALLAMALVAPCPPGRSAPGQFDCCRGFDALVAEIRKEPGARFLRKDPAAHIAHWRSDRYVYRVTLPNHPAHPAIFREPAPGAPEGLEAGRCFFGEPGRDPRLWGPQLPGGRS